jgi:hypothetical protein
LRSRINIAALLAALAIVVPASVMLSSSKPVLAQVDNARVRARSAGTDLPTARRIAAALLAHPVAAQLLKVRCERAAGHVDCGLTVSAMHFHRALDVPSWNAEVASLIEGAYAADPAVDEIDLWATVPLDAGKGAVVSGDLAKPTSATVFSVTVPRSARGALRERLATGQGVFWDPAFRGALAKGTRG